MKNIFKKIDVKFEGKDLTDLYGYILLNNITIRVLLIACILLAGQSVMNVIKYKEQAVPTLMITLVFLVILPLTIVRQIKKQVLKREEYNKVTTYIIKQDEIESRNGTMVNIIKWSNFKKVVETKNCLIFIREANKVFLIPKRYLNEQEFNSFTDMLNKNIEASKLKLRHIKKINKSI